ncbi:TPA: choline-sulfatase [Candidatus Poribacteria bacterium]|nr:choline-sulfatase [Candidatus Poribacteria bacterium]HIO47850.1 choline-sulfatase [Candidatus Poribacteria bacterium]
MADSPNILLIMADQLMPFLMGAYGHPVVKTPNLDRLVEQGVRFDAAYTACPLCAPARASLMTGTYISHNKVWDNAAPLASDQVTIAHYLSNAGYDTVTSGKLHYTGPDQLHGFRRRLTTDIYPSSFDWLPTAQRKRQDRFIDRRAHANSYCLPNVGVCQWTRYLAYDEETQFRALEYLHAKRIDKYEGKVDPFFLCVSFHCPHDPFSVTQEMWNLYQDREIEIPEYPANMDDTYSAMDRWLNSYHGTDRIDIKDPQSLTALRRSYYGLVTYIDRKVGELVKALERLKLRENTIVIFVSDHGDMLAEKNMVQKRSFYEFSSRVPMIMSFPDGWAAGTQCAQPVSLIDLVPTILQLVGIDQHRPLDGSSLLPCIEGQGTDRVIFSESHTNGIYEPCFMIRKGQYKYIYIRNEASQLFNLDSDPGEWSNLSGHPDYVEIEIGLRDQILATFNPNAIEEELINSLLNRELIKQANKINSVNWDYSPA